MWWTMPLLMDPGSTMPGQRTAQGTRPVVFLFPGQGSQYPGMTAGVYRDEPVFRLLLLTHRYLGIAVGLVVVLWCLSGFVMMYVQYPELTEEERLPGLSTLELSDCCRVADDFSNLELSRFRVEMLAENEQMRALTAVLGAQPGGMTA